MASSPSVGDRTWWLPTAASIRPVLRVATSGVEVPRTDDGVELFRGGGGELGRPRRAVRCRRLERIEALSGIPGLVGATPIQNVGAYGQEVSEVCVGVDVIERKTGPPTSLSNAECRFGYRSSAFKSEPGRYVVTGVRLRLSSETDEPAHSLRRTCRAARRCRRRAGTAATKYETLCWTFAVPRGWCSMTRTTTRGRQGRSSPTLCWTLRRGLPPDAPQWPQADGRVKTSAAWLIEHAGFERGFGDQVGRGAVTLSTKHTLALTNRGEGTTTELLELARLIRERVHDQFGIELEPEPTLVGCAL